MKNKSEKICIYKNVDKLECKELRNNKLSTKSIFYTTDELKEKKINDNIKIVDSFNTWKQDIDKKPTFFKKYYINACFVVGIIISIISFFIIDIFLKTIGILIGLNIILFGVGLTQSIKDNEITIDDTFVDRWSFSHTLLPGTYTYIIMFIVQYFFIDLNIFFIIFIGIIGGTIIHMCWELGEFITTRYKLHYRFAETILNIIGDITVGFVGSVILSILFYYQYIMLN